MDTKPQARWCSCLGLNHSFSVEDLHTLIPQEVVQEEEKRAKKTEMVEFIESLYSQPLNVKACYEAPENALKKAVAHLYCLKSHRSIDCKQWIQQYSFTKTGEIASEKDKKGDSPSKESVQVQEDPADQSTRQECDRKELLKRHSSQDDGVPLDQGSTPVSSESQLQAFQGYSSTQLMEIKTARGYGSSQPHFDIGKMLEKRQRKLYPQVRFREDEPDLFLTEFVGVWLSSLSDLLIASEKLKAKNDEFSSWEKLSNRVITKKEAPNGFVAQFLSKHLGRITKKEAPNNDSEDSATQAQIPLLNARNNLRDAISSIERIDLKEISQLPFSEMVYALSVLGYSLRPIIQLYTLTDLTLKVKKQAVKLLK